MQKTIPIFLLCIMLPMLTFCQDTTSDVKKVITRLFDGMRNADSSAVASVFAPTAIMQTIATDPSGSHVVKPSSVSDFESFIGRQNKGAADEQIEFETIKIDGPLVFVWTPYRFFYQGKFSHSGANAFCLVKLVDGWKIQYLIDTRRK